MLLLVGAGVVLLWVHDPRWGAAVLGGITVLAFLAKMIKLSGARRAAGLTRRTATARDPHPPRPVGGTGHTEGT